MKVQVYKDVGVSYIYVKDEIKPGEVSETKEIGNNIYADYDKDGNLLGIEFLQALHIEEMKDENG